MTEPTLTAPKETNGGVELGERLRAIRVLRRLTLREVAEAAGVSESFVSQLERGRSSASVATLQRLAAAVGIEISDLFAGESQSGPRVLRRHERQQLEWGHLGRKALLTPKPLHSLEVVAAAFDPGGSTGDEPYTHGDSEELLLVLDGSRPPAARQRAARPLGRRQRQLPELDAPPRQQSGRRARRGSVRHQSAQLLTPTPKETSMEGEPFDRRLSRREMLRLAALRGGSRVVAGPRPPAAPPPSATRGRRRRPASCRCSTGPATATTAASRDVRRVLNKYPNNKPKFTYMTNESDALAKIRAGAQARRLPAVRRLGEVLRDERPRRSRGTRR